MARIHLARKTTAWLLLALVLTLALSSTIQSSRTAEAGGHGFLLIFKTGPDAATPLQNACFNVEDTAQVFLFEVCDNNFQGPPQSHPACMPDGVCEDEDIDSSGAIQVTLTFADDYWVVESKAPPGYVADTAKKMCGVVCKLLFVNQIEGVGGIAELPGADGAAPLAANGSAGIGAGFLAAAAAAALAAALALAAVVTQFRRTRR